MIKRMKKRWLNLFWGLITFAVLIGLWQLACEVFDVPMYLVPPPVKIWEALLKYWSVTVRANLLYTLSSIGIGYALTIVISIPLAILFATSQWLEKTVYPILVAIQLVPKVALAPLFIVWFGFGLTSKVILVFLLSFFALLVDATTGFKSLNPRLVFVAKTMTNSPWEFFWKIRFPAALPHIFTGFKISISSATTGAIIAEFVGSNQGLGYLMLRANGELNTPYLFAALLVLSVVGIALYKLVEYAEALVIPWHSSVRTRLQ
ncbi:MAG: ABC transporter permease [Clostridiales bacterium]|jgi:NitT/TauT family transport system permease protein|nr:ABC transporter permease [Clostridiales bacterium]